MWEDIMKIVICNGQQKNVLGIIKSRGEKQ